MYYDSRIVYVNPIDIAGKPTVYLVEIQNEQSIRKIRVAGDDVDVVQEFKK